MRVNAALATASLLLSGCGEAAEADRTTANFEQASSLGRWCAKPSTLRQTWQIIEIVGGTDPVARILAGDGSRSDRPLAASSSGEFTVVGEGFGATYRLNVSDGDIGLYDRAGLVYLAKRMQPSEPPASCLGAGFDADSAAG